MDSKIKKNGFRALALITITMIFLNEFGFIHMRWFNIFIPIILFYIFRVTFLLSYLIIGLLGINKIASDIQC